MIQGGVLMAILRELPRADPDQASRLLFTVKHICYGCVDYKQRVRHTVSVTEAAARQVHASTHYRDAMRAMLVQGHALAMEMSSFLVWISNVLKETLHCMYQDAVGSLRSLRECVDMYPAAAGSQWSHEDTPHVKEQRKILAHVCGAFGKTCEPLCECIHRQPASDEWTGVITQFRVEALCVLVGLIDCVDSLYCMPAIMTVVYLGAWEPVQYLFENLSAEALLRVAQMITGDKLYTCTKLDMYTWVVTQLDQIRKRRLNWMIVQNSRAHSGAWDDSLFAGRFAHDDAFKLQGYEEHIDRSRPIEYVCGLVGIDPEKILSEVTPFIRSCMEHFKIASGKDGFSQFLDQPICETMVILIEMELRGGLKGVRETMLRLGVLGVCVDIVLNNKLLGSSDNSHPLRQVLIHVFQQVASFLYEQECLLTPDDVEHVQPESLIGLIRYVLPYMEAIQQPVFRQQPDLLGAFVLSYIDILSAVVDTMLWSHRAESFPLRHAGLQLLSERLLQATYGLRNVLQGRLHETLFQPSGIPALQTRAMALCLATLEQAEQLNFDQLDHLNRLCGGCFTSGERLDSWRNATLIVQVMTRYVRIPWIVDCMSHTAMKVAMFSIGPFLKCLADEGLVDALENALRSEPAWYVGWGLPCYAAEIYTQAENQKADSFWGVAQVRRLDPEIVSEYVMQRYDQEDFSGHEYVYMSLIVAIHSPEVMMKLVEKGFIPRALQFLARAGGADSHIEKTSQVLTLCAEHVADSVKQFLQLQGFNVLAAALQVFSGVENLAVALSTYMLVACAYCNSSNNDENNTAQFVAQTESLKLALVIMRGFPDSEAVWTKCLSVMQSASASMPKVKQALLEEGVLGYLIQEIRRFRGRKPAFYKRTFECIGAFIKDDCGGELTREVFDQGCADSMFSVLQEFKHAYDAEENLRRSQVDRNDTIITEAVASLKCLKAVAGAVAQSLCAWTRNADGSVNKKLCFAMPLMHECAEKLAVVPRLCMLVLILRACAVDDDTHRSARIRADCVALLLRTAKEIQDNKHDYDNKSTDSVVIDKNRDDINQIVEGLLELFRKNDGDINGDMTHLVDQIVSMSNTEGLQQRTRL